MTLFQKAPTQEEQIDYLAALRLVNWGWTQPLREKQFRWFLRADLNKADNLGKFMSDIRKDSRETLSDAEKIALQPILDAKPEAQPAPPVTSRLFVKHWATDELLAKVASLLKQTRDTARGQTLFRETGCVACHAFNGNGGAVGPDLSLVGGRFGTREILESIVEPSKVISDQFATFQVTLNDGTVLLGKLAGESPTMVQIQENLFEPSDVRAIPRKDVKKLEQSPISLMPPGLVDTCQPDEIADLVAFLVGGVKQAAVK
jgi:putative heme-binding domain-containing protein